MDACIGGFNLGPLESELKNALGNVLTSKQCCIAIKTAVIFTGFYAKTCR